MATAIVGSEILKRNELLTREQTAKLLGVKGQTLAVWASTGRYGLRFIRVGKSVRYRRSDVEAWLESRAVGTVEGDE